MDLLMKDLDGLTTKLIEVEATRDIACEGKVDAEATTGELKRIFTTDKTVLEKSKAKVKEDLASTTIVCSQNLKIGRQWQETVHTEVTSLLIFHSSLASSLLTSSGLPWKH